MTLVEAYRALGVDPATARRENVTKRYRDLVKKLHPDVRPASERVRATSELQVVNEAFAAVRSSGFPVLTPPPVRPASHPGNGFYAPPPPGNGFYAPPPGAGRYAPPGGPGNGYGSPGNGYAPPYGNGFGRPAGGFASPPGSPFGRQPFGGAASGPFGGAASGPFGGPASGPFGGPGMPRTTAVPGDGLVQAFRAVDGFINVTGPFYFFALILAFFKTLGHFGGLGAIVPLAVSMGLWNVSKQARVRCWAGIQALYVARGTLPGDAIGRDVARDFAVAGAAWAGALAVLFFLLAPR